MTEIVPEKVYFNSRVRGSKALLFSRARLEELLKQGGLQRMIDALVDSPYRQEMAEALTHCQGADAVEDAVSRNLVATFQRLMQQAQGAFREQIRIFLMRWDLSAVKSLIRTRHHGLDAASAAPYIMPGPTLTIPVVQKLAERGTMDELISGLIAWNPALAGVFYKALAEYREQQDPAVFEEALDRQYFVESAAALRTQSEDADAQVLRFFLQLEIDRMNLRYLFQHFETEGAIEEFAARLLPEGTLSPKQLLKVAEAGDLAGVVEKLENTRYKALVDELAPLLQTRRFAPVERFFERLFMEEIKRRAVLDCLGIPVVMDYAWRKYNEAVNLRLIARGLAGHVPAGRVREEIAHV